MEQSGTVCRAAYKRTASPTDSAAIMVHAKCIEGAGEQFMEKLRKLCLSAKDAKDFEDCCCAKCGEPVAVPNGMDFNRGDWCFGCNTELADAVREMMGERDG